jgi:multicomponent Na+:H+ antiporter subunit D
MSHDKHGGPSLRYAYMHILSGALLLCGIIIHASNTGTMEFTAMELGHYTQLNLAQALILIAILINCAAPPFSAWIADSYPVASIYTIGFLSSFTTKFSLFALLNLFPGFQPLLYVGMTMVVYGIIMSLNSNNIQKILCYNIVNQLGMLIAVISSEEALTGIAISACCGIIYQSLFFMTTGSVIHLTGKDRLISHAGAANFNVTKICMIIAGISMAALPFTIGFIGKTIITNNTYENNILYILLLTSNVGATLCSSLRLPYFLFFQVDHSTKATKKLPPNMRFAMLLGTSVCLLIGLYPEILYRLLPHIMHNKIYSTEGIITQLQLILSAIAAFLIFRNTLKPKDQYLPDLDWIYRVLGKRMILLLNLSVEYLGTTAQVALSTLHIKITKYIKGRNLRKLIIKNTGSSISITLTLAATMIGVYLILNH